MENIIEKLLQEFESGKMNRRQLVKSLVVAAAVAGPAAADGGHGFKAVAVNHISYQVADYAKTRDFYTDLLGMKVTQDNGSQAYLAFGETWLLPRTPGRGRGGQATNRPAPQTPKVDHIAYTIESWNKEQVEDELKRRGYKLHQGGRGRGQFSPLQAMEYRPDTENSFHILDPD